MLNVICLISPTVTLPFHTCNFMVLLEVLICIICIVLQIKMFLSKGVKLLDTTSSVRHYHTARPPEGKSFTLRSHVFTSMASVKNYWADLKCVCLNTPLGKWSLSNDSTILALSPRPFLHTGGIELPNSFFKSRFLSCLSLACLT